MVHINLREYKDSKDLKGAKLLDGLLVKDIAPLQYQDVMFKIGLHLGSQLKETLDPTRSYCLAVTAEDADFLAKGIFESLSGVVKRLYLTCFWNDRTEINGNSVAPIFNTYIEPGVEEADDVIVVKAIMAGSCVVKTNITRLFEELTPKAVHVVSPVMHSHSQEKLKNEFSKSISDLFKFHYLAIDAEYDKESHEVIPGVGGNVYEKLGFKGQTDKNSYVPEIIQQAIFA